MMKEQEQLLREMTKAIEVKCEAELKYLIAKRDAEQAQKAYRAYGKNEITHCIKCGKEITDYEDTEFLQQEGIMKFTYKCDCGFYGEQIFDVTYNRTEEIQ